MAHLQVDNPLPGILSLLAFRPETAAPLSAFTQQLLRGPSGLTPLERELIATVVSSGNECRFCTRSHAAAASALAGEESLAEAVQRDIDSAPVTEKLRALLHIAAKVRETGKAVTAAHVEAARKAGASDADIHDAVLVAAAFCMFNRYVDGLDSPTPEDPGAYREMGQVLATQGYLPPR
jgi:uncharacterized peroxidase-related enzyme